MKKPIKILGILFVTIVIVAFFVKIGSNAFQVVNNQDEKEKLLQTLSREDQLLLKQIGINGDSVSLSYFVPSKTLGIMTEHENEEDALEYKIKVVQILKNNDWNLVEFKDYGNQKSELPTDIFRKNRQMCAFSEIKGEEKILVFVVISVLPEWSGK